MGRECAHTAINTKGLVDRAVAASIPLLQLILSDGGRDSTCLREVAR